MELPLINQLGFATGKTYQDTYWSYKILLLFMKVVVAVVEVQAVMLLLLLLLEVVLFTGIVEPLTVCKRREH